MFTKLRNPSIKVPNFSVVWEIRLFHLSTWLRRIKIMIIIDFVVTGMPRNAITTIGPLKEEQESPSCLWKRKMKWCLGGCCCGFWVGWSLRWMWRIWMNTNIVIAFIIKLLKIILVYQINNNNNFKKIQFKFFGVYVTITIVWC